MTNEILKAQAVYGGRYPDNPLLDAMPGILSSGKFLERITSLPPLPHDLQKLTLEERRKLLPTLSSLFVPLDYMYVIYDILCRAITTTYTTRTIIDSIRQINGLWANKESSTYATQADCGSILGVPGVGKTSTIRRCLSTLPQVIEHREYQGQPFYCQQVLFLFVECPSDCSTKTLAFNIISALDRAIGSHYLDSLTTLKSFSASAAATQVKILCMTHHVGLIVVDEIQHAVVTARQNRQTKPLVRFLIELTNDTNTAVYFAGTPLAEELFIGQEHLKRRTRGVRLLPFRPDGIYHTFLKEIWRYQYTPGRTELTEKLANQIYDISGGIPAYIVKIFQEAQAQVFLMGGTSIDRKALQRAVDLLAIKVPRTFSGGTYISDFELGASMSEPTLDVAEIPRLYANKRGRRATQRDEADLLAAFRAGKNILSHLAEHRLLDRREQSC